jgi:hypothetical protein
MSVATLRKQAREQGIPFSELRGLTTEEEIQAVIDSHSGKSSRPVVKKKSRATVAAKKKTTARKSAARKSTAKRSTAKRTTAKTTARKSTARKSAASARRSEGGRNLIESVDFSQTDGWNPREDSAPDRIFRALKRARGNRQKAFEILLPDLWDFVNKTDSRGERNSKAKAEWLLRYRISRTLWDFAKKTGQHEPASNRATYGEGGTGIGVSGGMPVALRPDNIGKPSFKRGGRKTTRKATTARRTAKKTTAKRSTARKGGAKRKATTRSRK